jgi:chemotaxis-related protein WspD
MDNCWKHIGVWGSETPRCPELEKVIHCRNCDVFIQAVRSLLDRDVDETYRKEQTDIISAAKEEEISGTFSVIIFRVGKEWLALRTRIFAEIIESARFHSLPHHKSPVLKGVVNVHGEIQLCVSLRSLLGSEESGGKLSKLPKRMMVINDGSDKWAFPVDEVYGIYQLHPERLENIPVTVSKAASTFSRGIFQWNKTDVSFLDEERLMYGLARSIKC